MMIGFFSRIAKSKGRIFDFGRGKTKTAKSRHRRAIKRRAKNLLNKYLDG